MAIDRTWNGHDRKDWYQTLVESAAGGEDDPHHKDAFHKKHGHTGAALGGHSGASSGFFQGPITDQDISKLEKADVEFDQSLREKCHMEGPEYEYRMANAKKIQEQRYEWVQKNTREWVNILRQHGFKDEDIQLAYDRKKSFEFPSRQLYEEMIADVTQMLMKVCDDFNIPRTFRVVQIGSSVSGYSNNPLKGLKERPTWLTRPKTSDTDLVVIIDGLDTKTEEELTAGGAKFNKFLKPALVMTRPDKLHPAIGEFIARWKSKLPSGKTKKGGLQITTHVRGQKFENTNPWDNGLVSCVDGVVLPRF